VVKKDQEKEKEELTIACQDNPLLNLWYGRKWERSIEKRSSEKEEGLKRQSFLLPWLLLTFFPSFFLYKMKMINW